MSAQVNELTVGTQWKPWRQYRVSSGLFLDLVFTPACNARCPFCIARTKRHAEEDRAAWERAVRDAFRTFAVRSVILLGGEATVDPHFCEKLAFLEDVLEEHPVEHLILTTNGIRLRDPAFRRLLLDSRIDAVNLSRMHDDQAVNDRLFGCATPDRRDIAALYRELKAAGRTLRLNVNVWKGNLDSVEDMERFAAAFAGMCDAVKFTPLMETSMFGTTDEVTRFTQAAAIPESQIAVLWDSFAARHTVIRRASKVLGFVDYAEVDAGGCRVILKYAQVEDKYDRDRDIPTLKIYPNGCLSNEWSFEKDIRG